MIYIIRNEINQKFYIGKTTRTLEKRWYFHLKDVEYGSTFYFHKAIRKYGPENFSVEILEECSIEDNNKQEIYWIAKLSPEYNMTKGGDGGWINDQTGKRWKVKDSSKMGKHKNQWINDDGKRREAQSKRMKENNPSHLNPKTEKQLEAAKINSRIATEASKKSVGFITISNNQKFIFESKRALICYLNISYDVLNYRLKTGKLYNNIKFFEVNNGTCKQK